MIRSGRPSTPDTALWASVAQQVCFIASYRLAKYLPLRTYPFLCSYSCARCSAAAVFPAVQPISRRAALHLAPDAPPSPWHVPSSDVLAPARCAPRTLLLPAVSHPYLYLTDLASRLEEAGGVWPAGLKQAADPPLPWPAVSSPDLAASPLPWLTAGMAGACKQTIQRACATAGSTK